MSNKMTRIGVVSLVLLMAGLMFPVVVSAQKVELEDVSFQEVVDKLFGTTGTPGLLDGDKKVQLHAEGITLTSEQVSSFFVPSEANTADFADLILAAEGLRGSELKIGGVIEDGPFELKLSGKQMKLDGLTLTQAELDALIAELQGIPGLHSAKIGVTVDGRLLEVKLQNVPGRVKIEDRAGTESDDDDDVLASATSLSGSRSAKSARERESRVEIRDRGAARRSERAEKPDRVARVEKVERAEKVERPGRVEKVERVERVEKIERVERPDVARGGPGR